MKVGDYFLLLLYRVVPQQYYLEASRKICPGKALLDVGGARGRLAELLRDKFEIQLILDILPEHFTGRKNPNMEFLAASGCFVPLRSESVDTVVFHDSLHHLEMPELGLREAVRVLSPGGKLYIFDFDREKMLGKLVTMGEKLLGFPARLLSASKLKGILEDYGEVTVHVGRLGTLYLRLVKTRETS